MLKHALVTITFAATALAGVDLAVADHSDSDRRPRHQADVPGRHHTPPSRGRDVREDDSRHRYGHWPAHPHAPSPHWRPTAHTRPSRGDHPPGYHCRHCHYRTGSRDAFFRHMHHHHDVPWHRVGAYLAWHPLHLFLRFGGH